MASGNDGISARVAATANRLRLVQADFADDSDEVRREHLSEVVERSLADIAPAEHAGFLARLAEVFPSWDTNVAVAAPAQAAAPASNVDQGELRDWSFLVSRLAELSGSLGDEEKRAVERKLRGAGILTTPQGGWPTEQADQLRAKLGVAESAGLEPERTLELALELADFVVALDRVVWNTWKELAPSSQVRKRQGLHRAMGVYASGGKEVGAEEVKADLQRLRQLTATLISAVKHAGRQFAQRQVEKFSPSEIESLAKMSGGGLLVSNEVKCWRKYVEMAGSMDAVAIESELLGSLVKFTEDVVRGLHR